MSMHLHALKLHHAIIFALSGFSKQTTHIRTKLYDTKVKVFIFSAHASKKNTESQVVYNPQLVMLYKSFIYTSRINKYSQNKNY